MVEEEAILDRVTKDTRISPIVLRRTGFTWETGYVGYELRGIRMQDEISYGIRKDLLRGHAWGEIATITVRVRIEYALRRFLQLHDR